VFASKKLRFKNKGNNANATTKINIKIILEHNIMKIATSASEFWMDSFSFLQFSYISFSSTTITTTTTTTTRRRKQPSFLVIRH
jgi:hypothetical protein